MTTDVAIVGGGISGLTAARALCARGLSVRLIEREPACGGVIQTEHVEGFVIDTGPETLLAHKPGALALVRELGLDGGLVPPLPHRTTYVLRRATLRSLPETSALGLPTGWKTLLGTRAFSWHGALRMAAEALIPAAAPAGDESIGAFVRRRFGREAEVYVAEPVLAGLHRGDASKLSVRALFPFLARAEQTHGSVARAWRSAPARPGGGGSMSLRDGLAQIASRMEQDLPAGVAATGTSVESLDRAETYRLDLSDGTHLNARAVILATPAYATTTLTATVDRSLSDLCSGIRHTSSLMVALGYARQGIGHPLEGWGFVVPAHDRRRVRAVNWVSSKWPGRAPAGHALLRLTLDPNASTLEASDAMLIDWAHDEARTLLDITTVPVMARVYRRSRAMPQLEVGHLDRMAAIDRRLEQTPGLFVSAAGFRGVGLPDCIADAHAAADRVDAFLKGQAVRTG